MSTDPNVAHVQGDPTPYDVMLVPNRPTGWGIELWAEGKPVYTLLAVRLDVPYAAPNKSVAKKQAETLLASQRWDERVRRIL